MARYDNLPVSVVKKGDDVYEIGVTIGNTFFVFGGFKAGGFEADIADTEDDPRAYVPQAQPTTPQ